MRFCLKIFSVNFFLLIVFGNQVTAQVLDLTSLEFDQDQVHAVEGNWEFYQNELLKPSDFSTKKKYRHTVLKVPSNWSKDTSVPFLGVATYRATLKKGDVSGLALYFPIINSNAKVWANGKLVKETGHVSRVMDSYEPRLASTLIELPAEGEVEIIIQVSNFTDSEGGLVKAPLIGKISAIAIQLTRRHGIENFFAGSLVAMFIYLVILSFLYQNGMPFLWLSLICLGVASRSMILHGGSFLLPALFPEVSWEVWKKIEFGSVYAIGSFFPLYIYYLFKETSLRWPIRIFAGISIILCLCVIFSPQHIYSKLLDVAHIALLFSFIYAIYTVSYAWKMGVGEAKIILIGVVASCPFIIAEIVKNSALISVQINFRYLVELGVLVFLLFQVYLLSSLFAKSYRNLEALNKNLEKIVMERSGQLIDANRVKDQLLSVISHDIRGPLNSLKGLLGIFNRGSISADDFKTYTKSIEGDLSKTGLLVDNVLYWTMSQLKGLEIKHERVDLHEIISQNIDLFQTVATNKGVTLKFDGEKCLVLFDKNILDLALRNLIANAIKFSHKNGEIVVRYFIEGGMVLIQVIDKGLGMPGDVINSLLLASGKSTLGTDNEKGTGLGLSFSFAYLKKAGGDLTIDSVVGQGSTFTIILPH